jgi:NAD(P)-dependent dehydrogenase (short-subunit alcohol dehydrogenase family)
MSGRLTDKVAFITGAARGQGRAHAVRMANEGADIIAIDIAGKLPPCVRYDPATPEDLAETVRLVEATGRRILASAVDTRDIEGLRQAVGDGVAAYGRLDIIVANAGISAPGTWDAITPEDFRDVIDINVTGVWNTVMAGAQKIVDGGTGQAFDPRQQPASRSGQHADGRWRHDRLAWPGEGDASAAGSDDHAVPQQLGRRTRGHRRRGVLAGQ